MKKSLLKLTLCALCGLALTSCSLDSIISGAIGGGDSNSVTTNSNDKGSNNTNPNYFSEDRAYNFNYKTDVEGAEIEMSCRYEFTSDGIATYKNLRTNEESEYTYKLEGSILIIYNEKGASHDYYYYYDNLLCSSSIIPFVGIKEGYAASQQGTSTIGYYTFVALSVGDLPSSLSGDKNSKGYYMPLRKNGTFGSTKYMSADQFKTSDLDTSKRETRIVDITIGNKVYKTLFFVI